MTNLEISDKHYRRRQDNENRLEFMNKDAGLSMDDQDEEDAVDSIVGRMSTLGPIPFDDSRRKRLCNYCHCRLLVAGLILLTITILLTVSLMASTRTESNNRINGATMTLADKSTNAQEKITERERKHQNLVAFILGLNITTRSDLENKRSPASQALEWLAVEDQSDTDKNQDILRGRFALASLYFANKASWIHDENWMSSHPVCRWYGIECVNNDESAGRVRAVNLTSNGLKGTMIPPEIALLQQDLEVLDISKNSIQGTIPDLMPLKNLKQLYLGSNFISGMIPSSLYTLTHLSHLYVEECKLSGSLSNSIGQLSNLLGLSLHNNNLSGVIPSSISKLTDLRILYLDSNSFSSSIPSEISSLTRLVDLRLRNNRLRGNIPDLSSMRILQVLYLDSNKLTGEIPGSSLMNLSIMREIHLYDNELSSTIPRELGFLVLLSTVYLDGNRIHGQIPTTLSNLEYLESFYASYNELSGSIPSSFGALTSLKHFHIDHNLLSGRIPTQLGNLNRMESLFLNNNNFTGSFPPEVPLMMTNLRSARIYGNSLLTGKVNCDMVPKYLSELSADCSSSELSCECCTKCH